MITTFAKKAVIPLINRNFHTARAYYHRSLRHRDASFGKTPLLIYQMGKVGSSSVHRSLKAAGIGRNIYHIHFLNPELIKHYEKKRRHLLNTTKAGDLKHIWQYAYLLDLIQTGAAEEKWKIITLVRDPIARNLSNFFEHIELMPNGNDGSMRLKSNEYDFELDLKGNRIDELIALFYDQYPHDNVLTYFDREFKAVLGIDLYAAPFQTTKGYEIYRLDKADVLVIRLEDLNDCFSAAIEDFLGIERLSLVTANVSGHKPTADIYRKFKKHIRISDDYVNRLYGAKFSTHFYSPAELEHFKAGWTAKGVQ